MAERTTFQQAVEEAQSAIIEDSCDTADRMPSQESWDEAGRDAELALSHAMPVLLAPLRELAEEAQGPDAPRYLTVQQIGRKLARALDAIEGGSRG